ncbi:zinc-dependent alcohol dehydrogenase [Microbacterium immunditiarum]|uniref:Threonine dehydrogenase-like Zn-dependent dehydrogenase n=1 Tax=Microbacterium immunditiarum TaxID=337480 RepID=A0A7Y9GK89_9MICO|nr:alcohol dehydrogenase catalytic domain-containing protein [Microbacterium immunditiarum]NYE18075.1 threonine dehydrogenase-like Zn-dependent dehydrogenase [Microbacterium immunditiarum]
MSVLTMVAPGVMALERRSVREPTSREVLIKIVATGICGTDLHGVAGENGRRTPGQVMGHETAGYVDRVGDGVDPAIVGRPVTIDPLVSCGDCDACRNGAAQQCPDRWVIGVRADFDAAFAEYITVPIDSVVLLPVAMPVWYGALIEPLAVGYHAMVRAATNPNDRVLIIGGGPIGQAAAIACRRLGVERVVVSEPDELRGAVVEALGFVRTTPADLNEAVRRHLDTKATVVIDAVGSSMTVAAALSNSQRGARIVLVGMASQQLTLWAYDITAAERVLIGAYCYSHEDFRSTAAWAADHPETMSVLVDLHEPLARGPHVFAALLNGTTKANKVLLRDEVG